MLLQYNSIDSTISLVLSSGSASAFLRQALVVDRAGGGVGDVVMPKRLHWTTHMQPLSVKVTITTP